MELRQIKENLYELNNKQQLKRDKKGNYRLIYPIKTDKIQWGNLFRVNWVVVVLCVALLLLMYNNNLNLEECREFIDNYTNEYNKEYTKEYGSNFDNVQIEVGDVTGESREAGG